LDDFPRAPWVVEDEGHVDLHSWMAFMYQLMSRIAKHLDEEKDHTEFKKMADTLIKKLEGKMIHTYFYYPI
jgi:hypothetical protein